VHEIVLAQLKSGREEVLQLFLEDEMTEAVSVRTWRGVPNVLTLTLVSMNRAELCEQKADKGHRRWDSLRRCWVGVWLNSV